MHIQKLGFEVGRLKISFYMLLTQNDRESSELYYYGGEKPGGQFPNENAVGRQSPIRSTARGKMWAALCGTFCIEY
jgi:hypothetical protein